MKKLKLILFGLLSSAAYAQQPMSLDLAIQIALQKNQLVQSASQQVEYFKQVRNASTDIGKLSVLWTHGQYNSVYQDNNLTIAQTIPFPTLLSSQAQLNREQWIGSQKSLVSMQNELVYEVRSIFYQLLYLQALKNLLQSQDSLFADFARASSIRYKTGESNLLELTTAETQSMEVKNQVRNNEADIQIAATRLQALLRNETPVGAAGELLKRELPHELDTASLSANPQLNYMLQLISVSRKSKQVERNRILPDITLGYFNQSLTGIQNINGQDQYFGGGRRFQGIQLGLSIPLWIAPQLARARAAAFNQDVVQKKADHFQTTLIGAYSEALQELNKNGASLDYYQLHALKNAELMLSQARMAFRAGQIGYIEYLQSLKSVVSIKSSYLQSINLYNQSVVKIEYFLGKF